MKTKKEIWIVSLVLISVILISARSLTTQAQDYQINFTGTGGSTTVDSVKVENLTQGISLSLWGHDTLHLLTNVGIDEIEIYAPDRIHIYPNPTDGACSMEFETKNPGMATVLLCDITGNTIIQKQEFLSTGHHTFHLSRINSGTYFVRIESKNYSYAARIISIDENTGAGAIKHFETAPILDIQNQNHRHEKSIMINRHKTNIDFPYNSGDQLKLTGTSGDYRTILTLVPDFSQTVSFNFVACTDADNNNYSVVQIGTQFWMAENLKTTKYRNGDIIPNITSNSAWGNLTSGAMSWYGNNPSANKDIYGGLYNWYAVNDIRNLAPAGWHVPTDEEWTTLTTYLGDANTCGGKVKETGYAHWKHPNSRATNETGFTAIPGGYRYLNGTFDEKGGWSVWWCSTSSTVDRAPTRAVFYNYIDLGRDLSDKRDGFALRCIKN
jgi:uncharacterized protein (TIGR02145 family)